MDIVRLQIEKPLIHHWSGKFVAPDENWSHISRKLLDYELILMMSGTLYIRDAETEYSIHPGEYLIMTPTELQAGTNPSKCSFYWMHFSVGQGQIEYYGQSKFQVKYEEDWIYVSKQGELRAPERLVVLMKQLQDMDKRYHETMINNYLATTILCELQNQVMADMQEKESEKKQLVGDIKEYVKMHLDEPLRVQDVAAHFGYNEKYLTTMFHKNTGKSIKEYIMEVKMERARTMLTDSNFPVSEIAFSLGFRSVQQFSGVFRKATGMSPSSFRGSYPGRFIYNR